MKNVCKIALCFFLSLSFLGSSCRSNKPNKVSQSFPADINNLCIELKDSSKQCILSTGTTLKEESSVSVEKRVAEKEIGGIWGWYDPSLKMYVGGLTWKSGNGIKIKVGANPSNGAVDRGVLAHEFGHYWLISNFGIYKHDGRHSHCFENWIDAKRNIRGIYLQYKDGEEIIVDSIIEDGTRDIEGAMGRKIKDLMDSGDFNVIELID